MIKAQFIDLGRNNVNKLVTVKNENLLHKEIGKYILSKRWGMEETNQPNVWAITCGWNTVGTVKILEQ